MEKHKIILERLEEFKDEEIDREDLRCLDSLLADHERIEMESIEIGNRLLTSLRTSSVISKIIYHLIDDERKHHGSLKDLLLSIYIPEESFEYV